MRIEKIYLDMDGVLVDYLANFIPLGKDKIDEEDIRNGFFRDLPVLDGAFELMEYCQYFSPNKVEILTSLGCKLPKEVSDQKQAWLESHFQIKRFENRFNSVYHSKEKAYYAAPNILLIDDREKSINPFIKSGGMGILYSGFTYKFKESFGKLL